MKAERVQTTAYLLSTSGQNLSTSFKTLSQCFPLKLCSVIQALENLSSLLLAWLSQLSQVFVSSWEGLQIHSFQFI